MDLLKMCGNGGRRGTGMIARTGGEEGVKIPRYLFTPWKEIEASAHLLLYCGKSGVTAGMPR